MSKKIEERSPSPEYVEDKDETIDVVPQSEFNTASALALLGAISAAFCTVGFLNAFGVLLDWYHGHTLAGYNLFQLTWIGSFASFVFFFSGAPAGILVDRIGPTIPLIIGGVITVFSMFMLSLCKEYYQFFLAQSLLQSIGQAFLFFPVITAVSHHFHKNRGLATGATIAGSSLGGVIWPIMMNQLLNKHGVSFAWTIRSMALTMLPLVILTCAVVRLPPTAQAGNTDKVESQQLETKTQQKKKFDISILESRPFLTFSTGLGVFYFGMFSPLFFVTSYAGSINISPSLTFYLVAFLNGASLFGRITAGWFADSYGCFNLCSLAAIVSAIVVFCWTAANNVAGLIVWCLAYGFVSGSIMSLQSQCAIKLATPSTYGTAIGMTMGIISITGLFGSPIAGELIKHNYLTLSMYAGSALVVGALMIIAARLQLSRELWEVV